MFLQQNIGLGIYYLLLAAGTSLLRQFLEPKLIGKQVGANPLLVLASIYLGLQIYGIWGVLLGPATAFLVWEIYRFT
jgi:predicted PurR-regulated permease PerM